MRRHMLVTAALIALILGVMAGPSLAHNLEVHPPNSDEVVHEGWIGGLSVPAPAQQSGQMFGPNFVPPSHGKGLVEACEATRSSPAVTMPAPGPPGDSTCHHGGGGDPL